LEANVRLPVADVSMRHLIDTVAKRVDLGTVKWW
jgi:hypothetical protein